MGRFKADGEVERFNLVPLIQETSHLARNNIGLLVYRVDHIGFTHSDLFTQKAPGVGRTIAQEIMLICGPVIEDKVTIPLMPVIALSHASSPEIKKICRLFKISRIELQGSPFPNKAGIIPTLFQITGIGGLQFNGCEEIINPTISGILTC